MGILSEFIGDAIYERAFTGKERILHFLALRHSQDYSIKEISASTGQSVSNVRKIIKGLEGDGIVKSPKHGRWILVKDLKSAYKVFGQYID